MTLNLTAWKDYAKCDKPKIGLQRMGGSVLWPIFAIYELRMHD